MERKGIELNECSPMILFEKGKSRGLIYPVDLDTSQGVKFSDQEHHGDSVALTFPMEVSVPGRLFTRKVMKLGKPVWFCKSAILRQLSINPRLTGTAVDSELIRSALGLKPEIWQMIVCLIIGVVVGWLILP